ncbi:probable RNA-directed DNA polymerase from transposon X-element [Trichonephila clavipes]|nr:probable RNA-directed DNA polymerase from transposon X-element [Trichonephila clavipes]
MIVVLTTPGENPLLVASIYIPSTTSPSACIHDLEEIFALEQSSILCGDYNAHHTHWGCKDINPRGQLIKNLIDNTDTDIVAPDSPTRFGYNSASTIDFALTRNLYWLTDIISSPELSSDHNPIILNFQTSIQFNFPTRNVSTNWERFRFHLSNTPTFQPITAQTGEEIEEQASTLTNHILNAYNNASIKIYANNNFYIDNELKALFKLRNKTRKLYQFTRNPTHKTDLNRIQNKIHRKTQAFTQKQWEDKLASLDTVDGSLWNMTKGFKKRSPIPALNGNTRIAFTDDEKAETLADSLENQFQLNDISNPTQDSTHTRLVSRFLNNENNFDDSPTNTKPSEIINIINNFKIRTAPCREGITTKMCKHFNRSVIFQITNLINNILKVGYFPQLWKKASVIPILKPGKDPTLPDIYSFRPISLLPVLSKITEKIIQKRLCLHLNDNDILIPQQHGFRAGLSTSHQLLRVVEYIKSGFQDRKSTGAVFLDIQKAFDRVRHVGLLYKLIKIKTPPHLIKLINSFLNNRSFTVKVNNSHSSNRRITAGTPQGSSISPILFNIYVNDIPRTSQSTICMFADDTAILAQSNELQLVTHFLHKHIAKLEDWFSTWKIALNVAKTEAVFFSYHIKKEPPKLYLHNTHIPWSKNTKYLGVILDKRLTFKQHIIRVRRNFNISVAKVFPLIARKSCLSLRNKLLIYKLVLRPVLQYASPIWGHAAYSNIKMLETAQNKILKIITDSPWYIRNDE